MGDGPALGTVGWLDLTVDNAAEVRDFYAAVAGWSFEAHPMGEYEDYVMKTEGGAVAGVCHRRGVNTGQPGGWIPYVVVADLNASLAEVTSRAGKILVQREGFAVIEDPSGARLALWCASDPA